MTTGALEQLTPAQAQLLRRLPTRPSDGIRVKGATYRVAVRLRDRGLTVYTGYSPTGSHYFARTEAGEALIQEHDAELHGREPRSG